MDLKRLEPFLMITGTSSILLGYHWASILSHILSRSFIANAGLTEVLF